MTLGSSSSRSSTRPRSSFSRVGVQGQRGGAALGQRGIALVEELRHVAKEQGPGEGRGLLGGGLHDPQLAALNRGGDVLQRGKVVHILQAFAHGFQHDRETGVFPGDIQQLGGALALLPQGLPLARVLPGQQQGPGGALAETGGEQGAAAHLRRDDPFEFLGVKEEQLGAGRLVVHDGHPQHDAVVGGHGGAVQAVAFVQPLPDGEGPRGVDRHAEGAVQDHPPVAELVVEAFHHERLVAGDHLGGGLLLVQVAGAGCWRRSRPGRWPCSVSVAGPTSDAALTSRMNAPRARPRSTGRPRESPFQNGSLPGWPKAGETRTRS